MLEGWIRDGPTHPAPRFVDAHDVFTAPPCHCRK
jgi:hypothetical protein